MVSAAPAGSWSFDETSGQTASDAAGNGLDLVLHGTPQWTEGQVGGALRFDGVTTYGTIPDSPLLDGTDKLTISCWVKPEGLDGNPRFVVSKRTSQLQDASYGLFFGAGNKLNVDFNLNTGTGARFESRTVFENDRWYHIVVVYDGTAHPSQRMRLYVDGVLDRDGALDFPAIPDHASPLHIGTGQANYGYKFKGLIDELSIRRDVPVEEDLAAAHQGLWTLEKWSGMPYKEIPDLVLDPRFLLLPGSKAVLDTAGRNLDWYQSGGRFRGRLEVPVSGRYVLWLSAKTAADLYISTDEMPFAKRRIAHLSPSAGNGEGIGYNETNLWDQYASQMSEPIELEAGRKYYIEVLSQVNIGGNSQMRLAWAPENGSRTEIPGSALSYYLIPDTDRDDDSLPDAWETEHGLDPADNGAADIVRQGERGDFDDDGLTNREEYLLGTDPSLADTDGDGRSDYDEIHVYGSDPGTPDVASEEVVSTVDIGKPAASSAEWLSIGGELRSDSFRGWIEWDFVVPSEGVWLLQIGTRLGGVELADDPVEWKPSVDGRSLGALSVRYHDSAESLVRLITPVLSAGSHRLRIEIHNELAGRNVRFTRLDVRNPLGPDVDDDGIADWVTGILERQDQVASHAEGSRISPFCLEGMSRNPTGVSVNGEAALEGADERHWFFNLPLESEGETTYTVDFGSFHRSGAVRWEATNVLDGGELPVRIGDSLKLGAWDAGGNGTSTLTISSPEEPIPSVAAGAVSAETAAPGSGTGSLRVVAAGSNYLKVADSGHLDDTDRLTLSFRAKPDAASLDGVPRGIISKRSGANSNVAYSLFTFTGGRLFIDVDSGSSAPQRIDTGYVVTTAWQDFRIVFDGTLPAAQRLKLFVDGTLRHTASISSSAIRDLPSHLWIGTLNQNYQSGGAYVSFGGLLDDIRVIRHPSNVSEATTLAFDFENPADPTERSLVSAESHELTGTASVVRRFDRFRTFTVTASHSGGTAGSMVVPVRRAGFTGTTPAVRNTLRRWTLDGTKVDPSLVFQPGEDLVLGSRETLDGNCFRFTLYPRVAGRLGVAARLWENGPIAGIGRVEVVNIVDATRHQNAVGGRTDLEGYHLVGLPLLVTGLPPGGKVKVNIFRAGIMFGDGGTVAIFDEDDFNDGFLRLWFLVQDGLEGGICHTIQILDANGQPVGAQ